MAVLPIKGRVFGAGAPCAPGRQVSDFRVHIKLQVVGSQGIGYVDVNGTASTVTVSAPIARMRFFIRIKVPPSATPHSVVE